MKIKLTALQIAALRLVAASNKPFRPRALIDCGLINGGKKESQFGANVAAAKTFRAIEDYGFIKAQAVGDRLADTTNRSVYLITPAGANFLNSLTPAQDAWVLGKQ